MRQPVSPAASKHRLHTLDGMRGVAAIMVAVYHYRSYTGGWNFSGTLAVDFFFLLSGYVIALNYEHRLRSGLSWGRFFELRLIRLAPLYGAGLVIGMLAFASSYPPGHSETSNFWCSTISNALMLPSPCSPALFPFNNPSWSLFFEIAVNLVFAVVLWRVRSSGLLILSAVSACLLVYLAQPPRDISLGPAWSSFAGGLARTTFAFPLGMVIFREVHIHGGGVKLALAALGGLVACMVVATSSAAELAVVIFAFPALLIVGAGAEPSSWTRFFSFLGDLSYPIYAIHFPLVVPTIALTDALGLSHRYSVLFFVPALLLLGWLAAVTDARVRGWISHQLRVRRTAMPQTLPNT